MRGEPAGISERGELAVLGLCVLLSVILIVLPGTTRLQVADRLGKVLTAPYWSFLDFLDDMTTLRAENTRLQKELFSQDLVASALAVERREQGLPPVPVDRTEWGGILAPCRVTMRQRSRFATMVRIQSRRPLAWKSWQPVVNRFGFLGRLRTVISPTEAWVELMSAPDFALGVEFKRTGLLGVLRPQDDRYVIEMVGRDEDVQVGDEVITSGITEVREGGAGRHSSAVAPGEIPVGTVRSVRTPNDQVFKEILVDAAAKCDRNETVFVILPPDPDHPTVEKQP